MVSDSLRERYFGVIDQIVAITLKGQLRSKEQIYQQLVQDVEMGTGEVFERCLTERLQKTQVQVDNPVDELKQARASRSLRAMQAIQGEWERLRKDQQVTGAISAAQQAILLAPVGKKLTTWLDSIDRNDANRLNLESQKQLAKSLEQYAAQNDDATGASEAALELRQLTTGIRAGIDAYQRLEDSLVRWLYEAPSVIGFERVQTFGPWKLWAERVNHPASRQLFETIAGNQSVAEWVRQSSLEGREWVELVVLLQSLQPALVNWFEQQPYNSKWGRAQSIATFLTFAAIWCELFHGFSHAASRQQLTQGCFQALMQILRSFSQQSYFPLYGGIFALFSGDYLTNALNYLDEPLKRIDGTQEKARILTLLGYSQRAIGQYERAVAFHQEALEIARAATDQACEVANFNHLSRINATQKNYEEAINFSQRALILARQAGDRLGEANALTNLGYSEVLAARELERLEGAEMAISYLEQGLALSEKLGDRQSRSLCYNSLGIAHVLLDQPQLAIPYLEKGVQTAQASGDLYLQGLNLAYLAEAHYSLAEREPAVLTAFLSMYLLKQINAVEWRQPAGLLSVVQGQIGEGAFEQLRRQLRPQLSSIISVDGYDHLPRLLEEYRQSRS